MHYIRAAKPIQTVLLAVLIAASAPSCKREPQTGKQETPKPPPTAAKDDYLSSMHQGHAAAARWDQPGAIAAFRKALEADPISTPARLNLGLAQLLDNKAEDAVVALKPLLDRPPLSVQLDYLYGLSLLKAGKPEEAVEHLRKASEQAPHESSVLFQYGVALQDAKKTEEAAATFRKVIELDRFHITAPFRLARIERIAGKTEEADRWMLKSEQNRAILGAEASEREARGLNRFTKPMDPPLAWEPKTETPTVRLVDATNDWGLYDTGYGSQCAVAILRDSDKSNPMIVGQFGDSWKALHFENGRLTNYNAQFDAPMLNDLRHVTVADYDNDGLEDIFWSGAPCVLLLRQSKERVFSDVTKPSELGEISANAAIWFDYDHDGDVDLVIERNDGTLGFQKNRGNGKFEDDTNLVKLPGELLGTGGCLPFNRSPVSVGDLNDDDSTDMVIQSDFGGHLLFNKGLSAFRGEKLQTSGPQSGAFPFAIDDVNNDGQLEVASMALSTIDSKKVRFIEFSDSNIKHISIDDTDTAPIMGKLADVDADGFLDVLTQNAQGLQLWRNVGSQGWANMTDDSGLGEIAKSSEWGEGAFNLSVCDFDTDDDVDLLVQSCGGLIRILRNDSSKPVHALPLSLEGTKTNRSGIGARVDIRAGSARIFRNITSQPITIGVGDFEKLDLVKIIWPNGATDAFTDVPVDKPLHVVETTVTLGSCPHLYVWNNDQFRFVTDILGNAPLGLPYAPGKYLAADTSEIVWLGNEQTVSIVELNQNPERERGVAGTRIPFRTDAGGNPFPSFPNRFIRVEITDELRELLYLDEAKLLVVDHPTGPEVHPNDKVIPPPFPPSEVWSVRNARPPIHAIDDAGQDVAERLANVDNVKVGPCKLRSPQYKGLAETTSLTLDFGPIDAAKPNALVMNAWLHWGGASSNIAAAQNPALGNPFPKLEAMTVDGTWQPIEVVVGAPSGKTKTILVDLTGKLPTGTKQLRITWGLEVFWDRIALAERVENPHVIEFPPASADLYYRGVPRMTRTSPDQPFIPDYNDLLDSPPWRLIPEGSCTRFGDVLELLTATDDRYVIMNCGDACRIEFDVTTLPPVADGWSRDFFLYTDGWDKDMDHNVHTGHTVLPLPVHGQDEQRYGFEQFDLPTTDWIEKYNTRWVARQLDN